MPEIIKAQEVIIVEGEKDADTIIALGFTGTTSPMGAKKWREEFNDFLKGKEVVLILDNDNEGREHMALVGASLKGTARSLKWVDLPNLPSKGDITDWAAKFSNKEEAAERLSILIENAQEYNPPKKYTLEDAVLDFQDYNLIELPQKKVILHPIISEQQIILISGWRGVGKSWFALSLLDAITRGESFGPWRAEHSVPCLYCDGEMAAVDTKNRLSSLKSISARQTLLYVYSDAYANHLGLPRANLINESWRMTLKRILLTRQVKLWVLDNIASLAGGIDENSKKEWDPVNAWLLDLRFSGITTVLLHHVNKEGGQRGTSSREDNIDISAILKQPPNYTPEDGADFILSFSKSRVSYEDLPLLQDMRFQLRKDDSDQLIWTWVSVKAETKREVLRMLSDGHSPKEIVENLGISKGRISQIKKDAIEAGIMNRQGKIISDGY